MHQRRSFPRASSIRTRHPKRLTRDIPRRRTIRRAVKVEQRHGRQRPPRAHRRLQRHQPLRIAHQRHLQLIGERLKDGHSRHRIRMREIHERVGTVAHFEDGCGCQMYGHPGEELVKYAVLVGCGRDEERRGSTYPDWTRHALHDLRRPDQRGKPLFGIPGPVGAAGELADADDGDLKVRLFRSSYEDALCDPFGFGISCAQGCRRSFVRTFWDCGSGRPIYQKGQLKALLGFVTGISTHSKTSTCSQRPTLAARVVQRKAQSRLNGAFQ